MNDARDAVRVAYVAGTGRSGSTLLELLVGQLQGTVAAGEVTHLWRRGAVEDQLCGCGERFSHCSFWSAVLTDAFGDSMPDFHEVAELRDRVCRLSSLPRIALAARGALEGADRRYARMLVELYRSVNRVSGCSVIVDSSKYPTEAYLLRAMEEVDLSVLHIVRNPNAVAYSWQKKKVLPEVHWETRYYARYPFLQTAAAWEVFNRAIRRLGRHVPYQVVRYEDLVERPRETLLEVADFLGLEEPSLDFLDGDVVERISNHTVSGNALRLKEGPITLTLDDQWRSRAPAYQKLLVRMLTTLGRHRYGYV